MTPQRKKLTILTCFNICGMIVCEIFVLRHGPHRAEFNLGFFGFLLLNSYITYFYASKRRQPDTLIHLFPVPPETSEERS